MLRLLHAQFAPKTDSKPPIFISYAHEDRPWLLKLRSALRPLEHRAQLAVWDDFRLQPGDRYQQLISEAIARAPVAILLVSNAFFASTFIQQEELPRLLAKSQQGNCRLLWLLLEGDEWLRSPLQAILSLNDVEQPLAHLSPAQQQDALIMLRRQVATALE